MISFDAAHAAAHYPPDRRHRIWIRPSLMVHPKPNAKVVAFFSFGGSLYGGAYYDTQNLENVLKAQCLLASEMNGKPLTEGYGAPLRLRVENQLGYKMVKRIERIEFIESEKTVGLGRRRKNEDDEYFDLLPNIG